MLFRSVANGIAIFTKNLNDNSILVFRDGKTSWTTDDVVEVDINNVRLA